MTSPIGPKIQLPLGSTSSAASLSETILPVAAGVGKVDSVARAAVGAGASLAIATSAPLKLSEADYDFIKEQCTILHRELFDITQSMKGKLYTPFEVTDMEDLTGKAFTLLEHCTGAKRYEHITMERELKQLKLKLEIAGLLKSSMRIRIKIDMIEYRLQTIKNPA